MGRRTALAAIRENDFSEWYHEVISAAEMGEHSGVRGCMIVRPWGYAIWERIQQHLDGMIRDTGHENCYFPLFIPLDLMEKEAEHVDGFAKEVAVVTHHRLARGNDGKLVPDAPLEAPLVVRPTSEAMITEAFARWIKSYRDLPVKLNQWSNVVRWELRPRMFLRTSEFLWQEGHTAHATREEAAEEVRTMIECYRSLVEDFMAIPVVPGVKSDGERFPGAVATYTIEAMMQDGRALQAGTSHNLGQNFALSSGIQYLNSSGTKSTPYTTSWGVSTRLIGALIMVHGDDDGLRLPPKLAPEQIVILPLDRDETRRNEIHARCQKLAAELRNQSYEGEKVRVRVDTRDIKPADKRWNWTKKGVPLVLEIGPRDIDTDSVTVHRRDSIGKKGPSFRSGEFVSVVPSIFAEMQSAMYRSAADYRDQKTHKGITSFDELRAFFTKERGFVRAKWCGEKDKEHLLKELNVTIRCLPYDQSGTEGICVVTGVPATTDAIFAKSY